MKSPCQLSSLSLQPAARGTPWNFLFLGKGGTLSDFCLPGSLRGCGRLCGDAEERDKRLRAAGIARGWRGQGRTRTERSPLGDSSVLSRLQKCSSPLHKSRESRQSLNFFVLLAKSMEGGRVIRGVLSAEEEAQPRSGAAGQGPGQPRSRSAPVPHARPLLREFSLGEKQLLF